MMFLAKNGFLSMMTYYLGLTDRTGVRNLRHQTIVSVCLHTIQQYRADPAPTYDLTQQCFILVYLPSQSS